MTQITQSSRPDRADAQPVLAAPPPLARVAEGAGAALFLDFDGTLVEIADTPDAIAIPSDLGARLHALADRHAGALAVVSGRSIADLQDYLGPVPLALAGSHGGHVVAAGGAILAETRPLPEQASAELLAFAAARGLLHEVKAHGTALHYRERPERGHEAVAFVRDLAQRHGLATKSGKSVIELVPPAVDKGGAVELLMRQSAFVGALPVFIGDDLTDEDGFAACERLGGFGVIVGQRAGTAASYRLDTVKDVFAWLSL